MSLTFLSRKIVFRGQVQEVQEDRIRYVENLVKDTGEPLEEAIERLFIECHANKRQAYKPNTIDYYIYVSSP